ncbi:hypothetical protein R75461_05899 [Paraburkholderia nemoris]|nr:hypothetical protein R75461_05899 [Paraburkholderia nemoris]
MFYSADFVGNAVIRNAKRTSSKAAADGEPVVVFS